MARIEPIVGSSSIAGAGYDPDTAVLTVVFNNGRSYTYRDVPPEVYSGLMEASSAGTFFNNEIKGVYG